MKLGPYSPLSNRETGPEQMVFTRTASCLCYHCLGTTGRTKLMWPNYAAAEANFRIIPVQAVQKSSVLKIFPNFLYSLHKVISLQAMMHLAFYDEIKISQLTRS